MYFIVGIEIFETKMINELHLIVFYVICKLLVLSPRKKHTKTLVFDFKKWKNIFIFKKTIKMPVALWKKSVRS